MSRRHLVWALAAAVVLVGALFLFALPARTYVSQRRSLDAAATRVKVLSQENARLQQQEQRLQTDAEIERLAREQYGLVKPGEQAYAMLPGGQSSATIPPPHAPETAKKAHGHAWWAFWR